MQTQNKILSVMALVVASSLTACGGGSSSNTTPVTPITPATPVTQATYEVKVTNITNAQVLTPLGVVLHSAGYSAWQSGSSVTLGLENLAESGNPAAFLTEATSDTSVSATAAGPGGFPAGMTQTVMITADHSVDLEITVASMLANTNDAFTGVTNMNVGSLQQGESLKVMPHVYDAGSEDNTETAVTMPGPLTSGEGFNAATQSINNVVTIHPGVVTKADGLTSSALTEVDRWLGPAALIVVTRTQ